MTLFPQITSHLPSTTVHSRLLLVSGIITSRENTAEGDVWVSAHNSSFPAQVFPVRRSTFKALLHLSPGENSLTLDFRPSSSPSTGHKSVFDVSYVPLLQNPPLYLAIIVGSDSKQIYDDVPNPAEPATLKTAVKKLRMAGYLWQAYTQNEMDEQRMGQRTFRLDEGWMPDSLSRTGSPSRNTAKVHILRSKYTVAHIRDPERAQQNKVAKSAHSLFDIAIEAIREHPEWAARPQGEKIHVAALFMDSTYDRKRDVILGHAALGSQDAGGVALAIFGSHSIFSWPSCVEAVVPAFNDNRPLNTKYTGIDCEGSTYFMAATVGIGAFLHECGHLFGCPHQASGIMLRDYTRLYRAFSVIDPAPNDGTPCHWHRLDALRFLRHPSFALPSDIAYPAGAISVDPIPAGILITSSISPILFVEFRAAGAEHPIAVIEPGKIQYSVLLPTDTLIKDYKIDIFPISSNTETHSLGSTAELGRTQIRWDPALGTVYRTGIRGAGKARSIRTIIPMPLKRIRFYTGIAVDGMEFFSSTGDSALFGKRGGSAKDFELAEGEVLRGFAVRSGMWVDAVSVVTDRRKGPWLGGQGGGYGEALVPVGMTPVGLTGELADWVTGLGMEYVLFSNS